MKNGFFIRKTRKNEIARVMEIYEIGRAYMRETGNTDQWANGYPNEETVKDDIEKGFSYVVADTSDMPVGVFAFIPGDDPTYKKIYDGNWLNDAPYCTIHRIAVAVQKQGIASFVFKWAAQHCDNVRADTHCANVPMQNALVKAGFKYCGIIYLQNGDERLAYQKVVDYESENRIKIRAGGQRFLSVFFLCRPCRPDPGRPIRFSGSPCASLRATLSRCGAPCRQRPSRSACLRENSHPQ